MMNLVAQEMNAFPAMRGTNRSAGSAAALAHRVRLGCGAHGDAHTRSWPLRSNFGAGMTTPIGCTCGPECAVLGQF